MRLPRSRRFPFLWLLIPFGSHVPSSPVGSTHEACSYFLFVGRNASSMAHLLLPLLTMLIITPSTFVYNIFCQCSQRVNKYTYGNTLYKVDDMNSDGTSTT